MLHKRNNIILCNGQNVKGFERIIVYERVTALSAADFLTGESAPAARARDSAKRTCSLSYEYGFQVAAEECEADLRFLTVLLTIP